LNLLIRNELCHGLPGPPDDDLLAAKHLLKQARELCFGLMNVDYHD